ncbi:hypothetical protein EDM00_11515 [Ornithobacterium rhinotracheale]|uniref:hypothetical protein n=1 Tax=Ornithobacterium rhinotracheale TaxID=28251 RepID=UPI00129D01C8|nr:hypothetical protein [Ornithobacterium rhinotracheale]MRI64607.1 hypothetical protein [Ornithobacterium rhinotracheale]
MKLYKIYLSELEFVDRSTYEKYVAAENMEVVAKKYPKALELKIVGESVTVLKEDELKNKTNDHSN